MRISDSHSDVCSSECAVCVIVAAAGANARAMRITGAQGMRASRNEFIFAPGGMGMAQQSHTRRTRDEARSQRAYEMAAARPEDIDVLGLYDSFSDRKSVV